MISAEGERGLRVERVAVVVGGRWIVLGVVMVGGGEVEGRGE